MEREIESAGQVSQIEGAGRDANKTENHDKYVAIEVWLNSMKSKLDFTGGNYSTSICICRVPEHIRKHDHSAYNPKIISIGPFHYGSKNLQGMEVHKWRYLREHCKSKNDLEKFLQKMKGIESEARECYSSEYSDMGSQKFVEMMLLDGCFIIHFILMQIGKRLADDVIYLNSWMLTLIYHDMLLLENQLPFLVLECLWELIGLPSAELKKLALKPFSSTFDGYTIIDGTKNEETGTKNEETVVYHLLHLLHSSFQPPSLTHRSPTQKSACRSVIAKLFPLQFLTFLRPKCLVDNHDRPPTPGQQESGDKEPWMKIPSATELQEAGVEFKRKRKKSASTFFDVTFEHGLMEMPRLWVSGYTNTRFRNFIAFEQCFRSFGNHYTTYCIFIDFLVNTSRDVSILCESGIVTHALGSNEDVALLFNQLCKEIVWDSESAYLADVFIKATQYTKKRSHKWRAKLVHDYFSNPWSIISFIAAVIVISVTCVQTFFAVFPYFRPPKP